MSLWRLSIGIVLLGVAGVATAQLQIGALTHAGLSGTVGAGYSGSYGDSAFSSGHGVDVTGEGFLNAYYFSPNFLNLNVHPYYGRTQESSTSVSIGNSSGIGATVNLFTGTHFPGSFSFSKAKDGTGQFAIPGSSALVTQSNSNSFGMGWGANIPGLPSLTLGYSTGKSSGSIIGIPGTDLMNLTTFNLSSSYYMDGWPLNASYYRTKSSSEVPATLTGTASNENGSSSTVQLSSSHNIRRLGGGINFGYSHSGNNYVSQTLGVSGSEESSSGTANSASAGLNFLPSRTVSANMQVSYNDNLLGTVSQQLINDGGAPLVNGNGTLRDLLSSAGLSWTAPRGILISGGAIHQQQYFGGIDYVSTSAYANVNYNYTKPLFGTLLFNFGMSDAATQNGNGGAGLSGSVSFSRRMRSFDLSASTSYSQNVQTVASFVTSSGVDYGLGVSRKIIGNTRWHANFGGSHSAFSSNPGNSSDSERFNTGFSRRKLSMNLFAGQSHQYALITSTGLVTTGLPISVLGGNNLTTYNSKNYGVSGSLELIRRMSLMLSYSKSQGDSILPNAAIRNGSTVEYMLLRYPYRKIYFSAGYNRVQQGIVAAGNPLHPATSYSFGISRWIKAF